MTPQATAKKSLTVRLEGRREVKRPLDFSNLDSLRMSLKDQATAISLLGDFF